MSDTFTEEYTVKLNYQKPDGYWVWGHEAQINVQCQHGVDEKCNHEKAKKLAQKKYPGCQVTTVIYN